MRRARGLAVGAVLLAFALAGGCARNRAVEAPPGTGGSGQAGISGNGSSAAQTGATLGGGSAADSTGARSSTGGPSDVGTMSLREAPPPVDASLEGAPSSEPKTLPPDVGSAPPEQELVPGEVRQGEVDGAYNGDTPPPLDSGEVDERLLPGSGGSGDVPGDLIDEDSLGREPGTGGSGEPRGDLVDESTLGSGAPAELPGESTLGSEPAPDPGQLRDGSTLPSESQRAAPEEEPGAGAEPEASEPGAGVERGAAGDLLDEPAAFGVGGAPAEEQPRIDVENDRGVLIDEGQPGLGGSPRDLLPGTGEEDSVNDSGPLDFGSSASPRIGSERSDFGAHGAELEAEPTTGTPAVGEVEGD